VALARRQESLPARRHRALGLAALDIVLRPYAQVVFSRDLTVGALVLGALSTIPVLALTTLAAVVLAAMVAGLLGLGATAIREGGPGCLALLTAVALMAFAPAGGSLPVLIAVGVALAVLLGAAFEAMLTRLSLPSYVLPFLAATYLVHLAARALPTREVPWSPPLPWSFLPHTLAQPSWLDVPASLLFIHGAIPGLLVLLAILAHSRIAFLLTAVGSGTAYALRVWLRTDFPWSPLDVTASFNAVLAAMAIGGVWFVPQPSSVALAAASSALAVVLTYALSPVLGALSLPVLSLPFALAVLLVLAAARMRVQDRWPRTALPAERPEEALSRHLSRVRRFGELSWIPFRLPFRGEWFVSQGFDGEHTHRGLWRHGLDFEGRTAEGRAHRGEGRELRDYVCYGLPVLAAGAGSVVTVVDGVEDNRPGTVNTRENWGNAVVIAHGPWLYSVYAHLQPKSIRVKVGDTVTAGGELGRCGNSGRSAVPHLHFQVQRMSTLGSPTIPFELGDVVERQQRDDGDLVLRTHTIPGHGAFVRPIQRDDGLARTLRLVPGAEFELRERTGKRVERARVDLDLLGTHWLSTARGRLAFDCYDNGLVLLDCQAPNDSLLRYLALAWARLPFDQGAQLGWQDNLSRRWLVPRWSRVAMDLLTVVAPRLGGLPMHYDLRRKEGRIEIEGRARDWRVHSAIALAQPEEVHVLTIEHRGATTVVEVRQLDQLGHEKAA
jgi:murein DD-endopeptidase MepM/ murein hydrolase activator NlpD